MRIDLALLKQMHPLLPAATAAEYAHRAAVGLERHAHQPGVRLPTSIDSEAGEGTLHWLLSAIADAVQLDREQEGAP